MENVEKTGTRWVDNPADPDGPQIEETYTYYEDVYSYTYTTTYTIAGVNGSGYDVLSDEKTHTGRGINLLFIERK